MEATQTITFGEFTVPLAGNPVTGKRVDPEELNLTFVNLEDSEKPKEDSEKPKKYFIKVYFYDEEGNKQGYYWTTRKALQEKKKFEKHIEEVCKNPDLQYIYTNIDLAHVSPKHFSKKNQFYNCPYWLSVVREILELPQTWDKRKIGRFINLLKTHAFYDAFYDTAILIYDIAILIWVFGPNPDISQGACFDNGKPIRNTVLIHAHNQDHMDFLRKEIQSVIDAVKLDAPKKKK